MSLLWKAIRLSDDDDDMSGVAGAPERISAVDERKKTVHFSSSSGSGGATWKAKAGPQCLSLDGLWRLDISYARVIRVSQIISWFFPKNGSLQKQQGGSRGSPCGAAKEAQKVNKRSELLFQINRCLVWKGRQRKNINVATEKVF